jgi:NhaC family Na+:H+ antiporter
MIMSKDKRKPILIEALIPIVVLIILLSLSVYLNLEGGNQMGLIIATVVAGLIGYRLNYKWKEMLEGMSAAIGTAMPAIMILLLIGALAGTWLISGIVPTLIYYGLHILNPTYFLVAACIISAIVSLATGSSWSTIATVGVAMFGIGTALEIPAGLSAGAIISGAYFGDKMSPMSDTTNLAPAVAGTDLITHIRYMLWTTVPSIIITLIIFLIIGFFFDAEASTADIDSILKTIEGKFNITPALFIVPVVVIFMIIKKIDAIPSILTGAILGGVFAIIFQPEIIQDLGQNSNLENTSFIEASYRAVVNALTIETNVITENEMVNELFSTKGMYGMLYTIWLIVCAMSFGGMMEKLGLLKVITEAMISKKKTGKGSLILTTTATCIGFNVTTSDQYLAIVVPGKMFAKAYKDRGLAPQNLSRTLEDSGTVTSVLVPWNTCGMAQSSVLGIATGEYFFYCFFNILSPIMTVAYGYLGIKIAKIK